MFAFFCIYILFIPIFGFIFVTYSSKLNFNSMQHNTQKEVTIMSKVKKEGGFQAAFNRLPYCDRQKSQAEISAACFWESEGTFKTKLYGYALFRMFEVEALEKYFFSRGIDAWSGLPANQSE